MLYILQLQISMKELVKVTKVQLVHVSNLN